MDNLFLLITASFLLMGFATVVRKCIYGLYK